MVVEEAGKLDTCPVVLYFFCKNKDNERDSFISIARSLLSQLLALNRDILLPYYHDRYVNSVEAVLSAQSTIEDLLGTSIRNCPSVYIILDGIDECPRKEREHIATWFHELVEGLPASTPDQIRCLFVSQDDGVARKDFAGISSIKIKAEDNKADIEQFSSKWAGKIQRKFGIPSERRDEIAKGIVNAAGGRWYHFRFVFLASHSSTDTIHYRHVSTCKADINKPPSPGGYPRTEL